MEATIGSWPDAFPECFSEIFGKSIDGDGTEVLAESLSLIGKLFEIYFVRLIGTPNQNSKTMPASAGNKYK